MRLTNFGSLLIALISSCTKPQAPPPPELTPSVPVGVTPPSIDKWEVKSTTSKLDGKRNTSVNIVAEEVFTDATGNKRLPMLGISCSPDLFAAGIFTYGPLEKSAQQGDTMAFALRIDDGPIQTPAWLSQPAQGLLVDPKPRNLLVDLADAKTLRVEIVPAKSKPVVVRFDVRGLRSHLGALADCFPSS